MDDIKNAEVDDLISEIQNIHYQLSDADDIDVFSLERIVLNIENVLKRYDALDY